MDSSDDGSSDLSSGRDDDNATAKDFFKAYKNEKFANMQSPSQAEEDHVI
jgi:hypothetical protein